MENWQIPRERYVLGKILGSGAYGKVAMATDRGQDSKPVAIKYMKEIFEQYSDAVKAYREIHLLRQLDHSNIIKLHDVIIPALEKGRQSQLHKKRRVSELKDLYLVFEYMESDLYKLFRSNQFFVKGQVQQILYNILLGLKYMHSANVIHRDLKPENVLVLSDCTTKIADFGFARVVGPEELHPSRNVSPPKPTVEAPQLTIKQRAVEKEEQVEDNPPAVYAVTGMGTFTSVEKIELPEAPSWLPFLPTEKVQSTGLTPLFQAFKTLDSVGSVLPPPPGLGPLSPVVVGASVGLPSSNPVVVKRQLTHHVVTRWYRAPEVILCQPYTAAVDVWSVGCIFAELLQMIRENKPNQAHRRPLFPGSSCGELSREGRTPEAGLRDIDDSNQLNLIFRLMGTPSEKDLEWLDQSAAKELRAFRKRRAVDLRSKLFPGTSQDGIDLLTSMLAFDPRRRISVDEALKHPFLADAYDEEEFLNATCAEPLSVEVETRCENQDQLFESMAMEFNIFKMRRPSGV